VVLRGGAPAPIVVFMASTPQSVVQLFVRVGEHGRGIGTRLLELAKAESQGSLWLYTFARNVAACRFYERHGFRETERERPAENMYRLEAIKYVWERAA
jgi:ribosomal protein S18 acetylase RimI-like enzyme